MTENKRNSFKRTSILTTRVKSAVHPVAQMLALALLTPMYNWFILVFGEALEKVLCPTCASQVGSRPLGVVQEPLP
ncbi:MAG: hypothetical protein E6I91_01110 [Chloroflexi bacterium]|nr:MAG: hypothetical protein E6I91_01110 [Chloroflexota bacterium]